MLYCWSCEKMGICVCQSKGSSRSRVPEAWWQLTQASVPEKLTHTKNPSAWQQLSWTYVKGNECLQWHWIHYTSAGVLPILRVSEKKVRQKSAKSAMLGMRVQKEELNFIFIVEKCSIYQEEMLKTKPKVSVSLRKMRGLAVGHGVSYMLANLCVYIRVLV